VKEKIAGVLTATKQSFGAKVFFRLTVLISVITICFTAVFILEQGRTLKKGILSEGELFSQLVAQNLRLGLFSESAAHIEEILEYFRNDDVLSVTVLNDDGQIIAEKDDPGALEKYLVRDEKQFESIIRELRESGSQFYHRNALDVFEIWTPVVSGLSYENEEFMFFSEVQPVSKRTMGYIRILFDKRNLNRELSYLMLKGIALGLFFLFSVPALFYFSIKKMTRPLNKLTENVRALAGGSAFEPLPVETNDEIGKLALAFNEMADSLRKEGTEKKQLEGKLIQAQKMEAIGTLSGGIAHDFNNILSAIGGYGDLIRMKTGNDEQLNSFAEQILASVKRGATLTRSLLAFSRKQVINVQPVKIHEIVMSLEKLLVRLIGEDIEFRTRLASRELVVIADTGQIDQVLMNLTTNARDAMPGGGILTIETDYVFFDEPAGVKKAGEYAMLTVSDTGEGITEENKKFIFDPFFTTKEVGKGTGLGLAMAYGIIKQHDGYIEVESEPGRGTTFKIYLPLLTGRDELAEGCADGHAEPVRGTETVLLAEDDEHVRTLSKRILEMYGYEVIEATDGEEAIAKFLENDDRINLLLFDLVMPKKNGYQAYEWIREIRPEIKTLFMSGYAASVINDKKILKKALHYVSKPVLPAALLNEVRRALDSGTVSEKPV
jgi:signal transduction histidine kinase/CheY-like chemotaxis protein